jgi:hypothetical protein
MLFKSQRIDKYIQFSHKETELLPQTRTKTFFSHLITMTTTEDEYNRSYIKVPGVFANIGGFITTLKILFGFLTSYLIYPSILQIFEHKTDCSLTRDKKLNNSINKSIIPNTNNFLEQYTDSKVHDENPKKDTVEIYRKCIKL